MTIRRKNSRSVFYLTKPQINSYSLELNANMFDNWYTDIIVSELRGITNEIFKK